MRTQSVLLRMAKFRTGRRCIKAGIAGAGHIAERTHLPILVRSPHVRVLAICDLDLCAAKRLAEKFLIPGVYRDLTEMLEREELDVVVVLTPTDTHAPLATQVLLHGCHCLMEKPLALTTAEADALIRLSRETGLALHVTHNYSYFPAVRKAKALAEAGVLGNLLSVDIQFLVSMGSERYFEPSHWCNRMPGGVLYDIMPHLVMLLLDFLGEVSDMKVMTRKVSSYNHVEADEIKVMACAERGLGSLYLSMNSPLTRHVITIVGERMVLSVNAAEQVLIRHKPIPRYRTVASLTDAIPRGLGAMSEIWQQTYGLASTALSVLSRRTDYLAGHRYLIEASLRSVLYGEEFPVDLLRCREAVRVLEMMFRSRGR